MMNFTKVHALGNDFYWSRTISPFKLTSYLTSPASCASGIPGLELMA